MAPGDCSGGYSRVRVSRIRGVVLGGVSDSLVFALQVVKWRQVVSVVSEVPLVVGGVEVCVAVWSLIEARNLQLTRKRARMQLRQVVNGVKEPGP